MDTLVRLPYFRIGKLHAETAHHRAHLATVVHTFLQKVAKQLAAHVTQQSKVHKVRKGAGDDILAGLDDIKWEDLALDSTKDIVNIATEYAKRGLTQLGINDVDLMATVNESARNWAEQRAAEMVGMKYDDEGNLIENPDAEWSIAETTRDDIQELVTQAFEEHTSIKELVAQILDATTFSSYRANMVAVTEASNAQANGSITAWQASGAVEEVSVMLSYDHEGEDECDEVVDNGPYSLVEVLGLVPVHPNCECTVVATKVKGGFEVKVTRKVGKFWYAEAAS